MFGGADRRAARQESISLYFRCVTLLALICFARAGQIESQAQAPNHAQDRAQASTDQQSCRSFVQDFYDWYWNQFAGKTDDPAFTPKSLHRLDEVLQRKPPILSLELVRLLKGDRRAGKNKEGDRAALDFDPFLNSKAPRGPYHVATLSVAGDQCRAVMNKGHVIANLVKAESTWIFVNFQYSYFYDDGSKMQLPDNDLIHILSW